MVNVGCDKKFSIVYYSEPVDLPFHFRFPENPRVIREQLEEYEVPEEDAEKVTAINEAVTLIHNKLRNICKMNVDHLVSTLIQAVEPTNVTEEEYWEYLPGAVRDLKEAIRDQRLRIIMAPSWADMVRLIHPSMGEEEVQRMVSDIISDHVDRFIQAGGWGFPNYFGECVSFFLEFAPEGEKFDHILLERRMKVVTEDGDIIEGSAEELAQRWFTGDFYWYKKAVEILHQAKIGEEVKICGKKFRIKDRIRKKKRTIG